MHNCTVYICTVHTVCIWTEIKQFPNSSRNSNQKKTTLCETWNRQRLGASCISGNCYRKKSASDPNQANHMFTFIINIYTILLCNRRAHMFVKLDHLYAKNPTNAHFQGHPSQSELDTHLAPLDQLSSYKELCIYHTCSQWAMCVSFL